MGQVGTKKWGLCQRSDLGPVGISWNKEVGSLSAQ